MESIVSELHGHDITLYCSNFLKDIQITELLSKVRFDVAAITGMPGDAPAIRDLCKGIRVTSPATAVVIGGWLASTYPHSLFNPLVDFVVIGEGEETFPELIQHLEKNRPNLEIHSVKGLYYQADDGFFHFTGKRPLVDLSKLGPPRRELFELYRKKITDDVRAMDVNGCENFKSPYLVQTSRGCNHRCDFCSVWPSFEGKVRRKSINQLEREFSLIANDAFVNFVDDNFLMSGDAVLGIVRLLKEKNFNGEFVCFARADDIAGNPKFIEALAGVGLKSVLIGFETFRNRDNESYSKGIQLGQREAAINVLHQNGVSVRGSFIIDPAWGREDFQEFADFMLASEIDSVTFSVLTPTPGTELYKKTRRLIVSCDDYHGILPTKLSVEGFVAEVKFLEHLWMTQKARPDDFGFYNPI